MGHPWSPSSRRLTHTQPKFKVNSCTATQLRGRTTDVTVFGYWIWLGRLAAKFYLRSVYTDSYNDSQIMIMAVRYWLYLFLHLIGLVCWFLFCLCYLGLFHVLCICYTFFLQFNCDCTVNLCPSQDTHSWKAMGSKNPRWTNLILYGISGDKETRPREVKVNK